MTRTMTLAALLLILPALEVCAQEPPPAEPVVRDTVRKADGKILPNVLVISETATEVKLDTTGNGKADTTLDQNEVKEIQYGGTPNAYRQAIAFYRVKQYDEAIEQFQVATGTAGVRKWVKDYSAYYVAMCRAAEAEGDPTQRAAAIKAFEDLLKDSGNRWRDDARYRLGEIHLAAGERQQAQTTFTELEGSAHRDEMKLTASVGLGAIMMDERRASDALGRYDKVVKGAKDRFPELYAAATVGKAEALTALKRFDEAAKFLEGVLSGKAGDELLAKARLALGDCYYAQAQGAAGSKEARQLYKAALKNYLWNIVVFYNQKAEYAKSLLFAGRCWEKLEEAGRAQELYRELRNKFGATKWAGMIAR